MDIQLSLLLWDNENTYISNYEDSREMLARGRYSHRANLIALLNCNLHIFSS